MVDRAITEQDDRPEPPARLRASDLRSAFDFAPIGMAILTPAGEITECNTALGELLAVPPRALVGTTLFDVTHHDDLPAARHSCARIQHGANRVVRHECRFIRSDGVAVWVSVSTARVPDLPARAEHLIMHIEDIDDRKALEARLTHLALHDPLTGLANRTLLDQRIADALAHAREPGEVCLLFLDLDAFKAVNDRYGHHVGDAVLRQFADRISALLDPADTAARIGGDEFAVLCRGGTPRAQTLLAQLRSAAVRPFTVDRTMIALTASIGLSSTADQELTAAADGGQLMAAADRRMYGAKPDRSSTRRADR